ncbi:hypothetical protein EVAR_10057_1 [Eumeta japonica]|uniref:Uncharacterized protein n=1 Tax=Eumeta variegata TaxID=151549 RepID=A0A4C1TRE6_EUMVA|nr:hypothetical protein EVAR_10057_1 [Eumeta japonica]
MLQNTSKWDNAERIGPQPLRRTSNEVTIGPRRLRRPRALCQGRWLNLFEIQYIRPNLVPTITKELLCIYENPMIVEYVLNEKTGNSKRRMRTSDAALAEKTVLLWEIIYELESEVPPLTRVRGMYQRSPKSNMSVCQSPLTRSPRVLVYHNITAPP